METRAHHVLIGLFTLAVVVAGLLFGLWMSKSGNEQDVRYYDIVFSEAVSGLTVGSPVEYNGIRVGDVARLSLDPADPRRVIARVRLQLSTPVKTDTHARLGLANITGAANIQLSGGLPDSPALEGKDDRLPTILADTSAFARLRINSEEVLLGLNVLLDNAKQLLSEENVRHLSSMLANLEATSGVIAGNKAAIGQGIQDLAQASLELKQTLALTSRLLKELDGQLDDRGNRLLDNADQTLLSLRRISTNLEGLLSDNRQSLGAGLQSMAELGPTITQLRNTLVILGEVARRLQDDPAGYLLQPAPMKEYQP